MQNRISLDTIVEQQNKGDAPYKYDEYQKYLILLTISQYLTNIHSNNQVHRNVRLTNILLDDKYSPQITFEQKEDESIKYLVSLSPEAIEHARLTKESDIYSFGVIILQVLTHKINIFSDYSEDADTIKLLIKNNINPFNHSENVPSCLSSILSLCFSGNKTKRPSARTIQSILEKILSEKQYEKQMNELKKSYKPKIIKQISIPSSVTSIRNNCFAECSSLKQISIPSSVISIRNNCFAGCSSIFNEKQKNDLKKSSKPRRRMHKSQWKKIIIFKGEEEECIDLK